MWRRARAFLTLTPFSGARRTRGAFPRSSPQLSHHHGAKRDSEGQAPFSAPTSLEGPGTLGSTEHPRGDTRRRLVPPRSRGSLRHPRPLPLPGVGGSGALDRAGGGRSGDAGSAPGQPRSSPHRSYSEKSLSSAAGPSPSRPRPAPAASSPRPGAPQPSPAATPGPPRASLPAGAAAAGREASCKKRGCHSAGGSARSGLVFFSSFLFRGSSRWGARLPCGSSAHFTLWKTWTQTSSSAVMHWGKGERERLGWIPGFSPSPCASAAAALPRPPSAGWRLAGCALLLALPGPPSAPAGHSAGQGRATASVRPR